MTQHQLLCIQIAVNSVYICVHIPIFNLTNFPFPAKSIIGSICDRLLAVIRYIDNIWDGWQNVISPIVWDFPDI